MAEAPAPTPDNEQQPDPVVPATDAVVEVAPAEVTANAAPAEPVVAPAAEPVAIPEPEPEPEPEPAPAPAPVAGTPSVASTVELPAKPAAAPASSDQDGGEWDLLVQKLRHWMASGQLQEQWQAARTPLSLLAGLVALLLVLRVYSAVLNVLDSIPLLPGLLELAGVVAVVQFSLSRLVRSADRQQVIGGLKQRWQSFRGRS